MLYQKSECVYANEIDFDDGSIAGMFDPFVLTTYLGKHIVSCNVTMLGEDHGTSIVVPRNYVRGMSDLNILHQEAMAKGLRLSGVECIDLEYDEISRVTSQWH